MTLALASIVASMVALHLFVLEDNYAECLKKQNLTKHLSKVTTCAPCLAHIKIQHKKSHSKVWGKVCFTDQLLIMKKIWIRFCKFYPNSWKYHHRLCDRIILRKIPPQKKIKNYIRTTFSESTVKFAVSPLSSSKLTRRCFNRKWLWYTMIDILVHTVLSYPVLPYTIYFTGFIRHV